MDEKKVYKMEDFNREAYKRRFKAYVEKAKGQLNELVFWVGDNKEAILLLSGVGATAVSSVKGITKRIDRKRALRKEQELKELTKYDRSAGMYVKLKRPLTNKDWKIINERKANGETLSSILESMKLIK